MTAVQAVPVQQLLRVPPRVRSIAREVGLLLGLLGVWQCLVQWSGRARLAAAVAAGRGLWHLERLLGLPSEITAQHGLAVLGRFFAGYYSWVHGLGTAVVFLAVACLRPEAYRRGRTLLALSTGACFLVQLRQVAPPRLIGVGSADTTAALYAHLHGYTDQLSAFPSVHVAWAVVVALVLAEVGGVWSVIGAAHALLTVLAVVVTGNHYWLDAVAAALLVLGVFLLQRQWERRRTTC